MEFWVVFIVSALCLYVVCLSDPRFFDWVVENKFSRRFIMPVWEQIKRPVAWLGEKISR